MVLEKQDSGVCLSPAEPNSPTDVAGVARPVAFFVDVGGPPAGTGATGSAGRKVPTASSGGDRALPLDADRRRTTPRSTSSPRAVSGTPGRPQGDVGGSGRRSVGGRFHGALQKLSTKVTTCI